MCACSCFLVVRAKCTFSGSSSENSAVKRTALDSLHWGVVQAVLIFKNWNIAHEGNNSPKARLSLVDVTLIQIQIWIVTKVNSRSWMNNLITD